ncbi:hypothetical protein Tco_1354350 [Tanacetum coccineum]
MERRLSAITSIESAQDVLFKRRIIVVTKVEIVEWHDFISTLNGLQYEGMRDVSTSVQRRLFHSNKVSKTMNDHAASSCARKRIEWILATDLWSQRTRQTQDYDAMAIDKSLTNKEDNEEFWRDFRWTTIRRYKAVRLRFLDPMIQPEPEGLPRYPLDRCRSLRFNTTDGNPVKKILLKLNLSDHRLCKMVMEVPIPAGSQDP